MKTYKILALVCIFASGSCESQEDRIKSQWKYMEGFHFGDFLDFDNETFLIKVDTIYNSFVPVGIVESYESGYFGGENKLILKDIKSGKLGSYTDKD